MADTRSETSRTNTVHVFKVHSLTWVAVCFAICRHSVDARRLLSLAAALRRVLSHPDLAATNITAETISTHAAHSEAKGTITLRVSLDPPTQARLVALRERLSRVAGRRMSTIETIVFALQFVRHLD